MKRMNANLLEVVYICPMKTTSNFYPKIVACRFSNKMSHIVK